MSVLILTATIDSGYFGNVETKIWDTQVRRAQYHEVLEKYIIASDFDKLVFAENSGSHLDEAYFEKLAEEHHKQFLSLIGNIEQTQKYGKSYGEAKLIADAVEKSALLKGEKAFYKVTGRVWIENINELIKDRKTDSQFISYNYKQWLVTIFFRITISDYYEYLKDVVDEYENGRFDELKEKSGWLPIEKLYYAHLIVAAHKIKAFNRYPDFRGNLGGTNLPYTKSAGNLFCRNVLNCFGFFNLSRKSSWSNKMIEKMFEAASKIFAN